MTALNKDIDSVVIQSYYSVIYDQKGNKYRPSSVSFSNKESIGSSIYADLIQGVETPFIIKYPNIDNEIYVISKAILARSTYDADKYIFRNVEVD